MMMLGTGTKYTMESKRKVKVEKIISSGGQGEAYAAIDMKTGQKGVLKVFHPHLKNDAVLTRVRFLVSQNLKTLCPVLYAPEDILTGDLLGHFAPFAEGVSLEDYLGKTGTSFMQNIQLAISVTHAVGVLHARGIVHGDIHASNFLVNKAGSVAQLALIDMDNFKASGLPEPPCVGHRLYMAPELDKAFKDKKPAIVTYESELYSLAVLIHEILLLRHPLAGFDESAEEFENAKNILEFPGDPARSTTTHREVDGYPIEVLSSDIMRAFRLSLSRNPSSRLSADSWKENLLKAYNAVHVCPDCGTPVIVDSSKIRCPHPKCGHKFPHLTLQVGSLGKKISLTDGSVVIGRADLGGSPHVSDKHAIIRRNGPETWLESIGRNGTYRMAGSSWLQLPNNHSVLIQAGDRLRFADVEVNIQESR
jgi:serine/threonine protein kinase